MFLWWSLPNGISSIAPELFRRLGVGPVNAFGLTMREADSWESARLIDVDLALSGFRFRGVIAARPGSAYAGR
jgi:hypothetical protein